MYTHLNVRFQSELHLYSKSISVCSWSESNKLPTGLKHLVSSANNSIIEETAQSGMSLLYKRNSKGPNTLPWGIPDKTGNKWECMLLIFTHCWRFNTYDLNQSHELSEISIDQSLSRSSLCGTLS